MSDYLNGNVPEDEIDAILNEVRGGNFSADTTENADSAKSWSMSDIDRLIAEAEGVEYTADEDASDNFISAGFDESMFTFKPIEEDTPVFEDITSGTETEEDVDGQEKFYDDSVEEFDIDSFELEMVNIPEDEQGEEEIKYTNTPVYTDPLPPVIKEDEDDNFNFSFDDLLNLEDNTDEGEAPAVTTAPDISFAKPVEEAPAPAEAVVTQEEKEAAEEKKIIDYRAKFFRKLTLEDIDDGSEQEEQEDPIEKSGTVVFKPVEPSTEIGLDSIPKVMAAEDVKVYDDERTKIVHACAPETKAPGKIDDAVEGQMVLTGFTDIPDEAKPEHTEEGEVQENLWQARKQKARDFKVDEIVDDDFSDEFDEISQKADNYIVEAQDDDQGIQEAPTLTDLVGEYTNKSERSRIHAGLKKLVKKATRQAIIMAIIEAFMFVFAVLPVIPNIELDAKIFCVINAVLIIIATAFDSEKFFDSITGIFRGKVDVDTAVSVSLIAALVENTLCAVIDNGASVPVFGLIAASGVLLSKITDAFDAARIYSNFSVCAFNYEHNMYAVHPFDNESEIFELGRGLLMGNAEMLYSSNVEFTTDFVGKSENSGEGGKHVKLIFLISAVASVIAGIVTGVVKADFMSGLSVCAASICLSMPVFSRFIPSFILYINNRALNHEGTMVVNLDTAEKIASSNAVVLESADIFDRRACTMYGMKEFSGMRIDVVLLYAAALVIKSGGPLKDCFESVVDGRQDLLPPVRELVYEDKMGISARIYEQKVLLGNRNMLAHHNITPPDKAFEGRYLHDDRKVIYLAVNGQLAAMFVVGYVADPEMKTYLKLLEKSGIQTLVRTNDVNVTENLISERFGINPNNFKILSSVAGRLYKRRKDAVLESIEAGVIHDGNPGSMLKAVAACCSMTSRKRLGSILQYVLMAVGIILTVVFGCSNSGLTVISAILILIIELVITACALVPFETLFKKKKD